MSTIPTRPPRPGSTIPSSPREIFAKGQRQGQAKFHRQVLQRDGGRCVYCGRSLEELSGVGQDRRKLIANHKLPLKMGGTNDVDNGETLCALHDSMFGWRAKYKQAQASDNVGSESN